MTVWLIAKWAALRRGRHGARKLKRAQILLPANDGVDDAVIVATVKVNGSTLYRNKRRLADFGSFELVK